MYAVRLEKLTNSTMMTCRSQRALKKAQQHRGDRGVRLFIDALARGIVDPPDPIEAIKFRMEQLDLKPADLADILGAGTECPRCTETDSRDDAVFASPSPLNRYSRERNLRQQRIDAVSMSSSAD